MSSIIISSASRSSPGIFIYHSSHIIYIPSTFHSIIFAFFTFPLIHFTMVLFAISSILIFSHFIYHTILFIIPSLFPSYFNSITLITTHLCFSFPFASMFSIHSFYPFPSHSSYHPLQSYSLLSISIPILSFHSIPSFPFISYFSFDSSFSHVLWYPRPSSSLALFHFIHSHSYFSIFFLCIPLLSFLRFLSTSLNHEFFTMFVRIVSTVICCVDRKHSRSIRRNCLCFWCMIREQWHQMIRK